MRPDRRDWHSPPLPPRSGLRIGRSCQTPRRETPPRTLHFSSKRSRVLCLQPNCFWQLQVARPCLPLLHCPRHFALASCCSPTVSRPLSVLSPSLCLIFHSWEQSLLRQMSFRLPPEHRAAFCKILSLHFSCNQLVFCAKARPYRADRLRAIAIKHSVCIFCLRPRSPDDE